MSLERPRQSYSSKQIAEFEKTRIQDPEQAHEEANMLKAIMGERTPTAEDYDEALLYLEEMQKQAVYEPDSEFIDKLTKPLRNVGAGAAAALPAAVELARLAFLNIGDIALQHPAEVQAQNRRALIDLVVRDIPEDYAYERDNHFATARETLKRWKKLAAAQQAQG